MYLLTISSPNIDNVAMSLYDIIGIKTYSPIVSCRHVVPVILLHMALYHVVTRARRPFARVIIANGFLSLEVKYNGAEKCHLPTTMQRSQVHKGMQLIECRAILW